MKKKVCIISIILILLALIIFLWIKFQNETMRAVVVKVNENSLYVIELNSTNGLDVVSFSEEGDIGFKQGQEILIYYDGVVLTSYPGQIDNVEKIKIVKEKSDIIIPNNILSHVYSSIDNVSVLVDEITETGITFNILDSNEIPFEYSNHYRIRNKHTWKDLEANTDIVREDTIELLSNEEEHDITTRIDWSQIYGELEEGEYEFSLFSNSSRFSAIIISFTIDENGKVVYEEPQISF